MSARLIFRHKDGKVYTIKIGFLTTVGGVVKDVMANVTWRELCAVCVEW